MLTIQFTLGGQSSGQMSQSKGRMGFEVKFEAHVNLGVQTA